MWLFSVFEVIKRAIVVPVAQLDRALASDAKGRGFEPLRVRHLSPAKKAGLMRFRRGEPWVRSIPTKSFVALRFHLANKRKSHCVSSKTPH